ncbi:MAG: ATP-binding protein, partial [Gammaproteobacteria bacterium]|nr:ATP-binding protein [Gammaproteobacteria bacterium]
IVISTLHDNGNQIASLSQKRLEEVQAIAKLGHWESDIINNKLWLSAQLNEIYELDDSVEPHYRTLLDCAHPDDKNIVRSAIQQCMRDGAIGAHEYRIITGKGNIKYIQAHAVVKYNQNNEACAMAGTIQDITERKLADIELEKYKSQLEEMVQARTREIERLDSQLLSASRRAGMAEVASNVLHNVGNLLNSVNVSVSLVKDNIRKVQGDDLERFIQLLERNEGDVEQLLTNETKRGQLLVYLKKLQNVQASYFSRLTNEIHSIAHNVDNIKHIVNNQQSLAGDSNIIEPVHPETIVSQALQITGLSDPEEKISVPLNCTVKDKVLLESHKCLQILINLLTNAREAVCDSDRQDKVIQVSVDIKDRQLKFSVIDNGPGIKEGTLSRVFAAGYSSRGENRGYGLHSSALLAEQMGGTIQVTGNKKDKGTIFTLSLPV